jgi:hypothetical protein
LLYRGIAALAAPWQFGPHDQRTAPRREFPPATRDDWLKLVRAALKERPFERLTSKTYDGIVIEPLYPRAGDARPIAARSGHCQVMARSDHSDPAAANAACARRRGHRIECRADYSITSLARSRIEVGSSMPIALAVLRLTTNSNLVGNSTGKSAGLAPWRILAT